MKRETKVGLVVAASFVCLAGGVFATKLLNKATKGMAPVAQAPEKPATGEETQSDPPGAPLYKPPETLPALDAPPFEPKTKLGPPDLTPIKPATAKNDDPTKDDEFIPTLPAPTKPAPTARGDDDLPLLPVPSQPAKSSPPPLDLDPPPVAAKDKKALSPTGGSLAPPPSGGLTRVANPPMPVDPIQIIDLPAPGGDKKKDDPKKDPPSLPAPGAKDDLPDLNLPPPSGDKSKLAPPSGDKPMGDKVPVPPPPPPVPSGTKPGDAPPKPLDLPPAIDLPKKPPEQPRPMIDLPGPAPKPAPPPEPRDDGSAMLPKNGNNGAAASITRPTPANDVPPPEARVESYDEEWYYCKQGDTLESISQKFFFTPKYEQALRQYNLDRNYQASFRQERPSLVQGQVVKVPPARILEKLYPASLPGFRPTSNPRPDGSTANIPSTPTPGGEDLGSPREYQVKREGMTLRDIAKEELRDANQWTRIFMLNREWNPSAPIPVGTRIFLPRAQ